MPRLWIVSEKKGIKRDYFLDGVLRAQDRGSEAKHGMWLVSFICMSEVSSIQE